jgi:hypothetical protein
VKKFLIVLISLLAPCQIILASEYIGEYKCEPTFIQQEEFLILSNNESDIEVIAIKQYPNYPIGLIDEDFLAKVETSNEDFDKWKKEKFESHTFNLLISENGGKISQFDKTNPVEIVFHSIIFNDYPKLLAGYTEFSSEKEKEDFWYIRDGILVDVWNDIDEMVRNGSVEELNELMNQVANNLLLNLYTISDGNWIEIEPTDINGELNFTAKDASRLFSFNVKESELFKAKCRLI